MHLGGTIIVIDKKIEGYYDLLYGECIVSMDGDWWNWTGDGGGRGFRKGLTTRFGATGGAQKPEEAEIES